MTGTVSLLVKDGIKKITVRRDTAEGVKSWLVKMAENPAFVIGEVDDGSFAVADTNNLQRADEMGLL